MPGGLSLASVASSRVPPSRAQCGPGAGRLLGGCFDVTVSGRPSSDSGTLLPAAPSARGRVRRRGSRHGPRAPS